MVPPMEAPESDEDKLFGSAKTAYPKGVKVTSMKVDFVLDFFFNCALLTSFLQHDVFVYILLVFLHRGKSVN